MGIFDDKHFRLGRVTNMDARSNKALIELIESSIDQLTTLVNSGRFSGDELDAMICELNTLHSQLNYQRGMKCVMDVEHAEKEKENHIPKDIGVFVNNHNDYDEVMAEHIARCIDNNFNGLVSSETANEEIQCIKDRWIGSTKTNGVTTIPYTLSNGVQIQLDMGYSRRDMDAISRSCEKIAKDKELPIKAFKFGYSAYLKLMEGSNPIEKDDVRIQDFTMVSMAYNILTDGGMKIRPVYKFNIPVNGNTVYLSFVVHNGKATNVNWMTSLNRKKVGLNEFINSSNKN